MSVCLYAEGLSLLLLDVPLGVDSLGCIVTLCLTTKLFHSSCKNGLFLCFKVSPSCHMKMRASMTQGHEAATVLVQGQKSVSRELSLIH